MARARRLSTQRRPWSRIGGWIVLLLLPQLAGCSGTPFGEALSRSFPDPAGPGSGATSTAAPPTPTTAVSTAAGQSSPTQATPTGPATPQPPGTPGSPAAPGASEPGSLATKPSSGTRAPRVAARPPAPPPVPGSAPEATAGSGRRQGTATAPAAGGSSAAPYRVTLRLPQADPSAPAEVVTEALRSAGVPFEVETIERIGTATPTPQATAPQVRPAPPPR